MKRLVLINPNGNGAATAAMVAQAQQVLGLKGGVLGKTNAQAPQLLLSPADMQAAATGVLALGQQAEREHASAIMVAAFSDPGLAALRARVSIPVFGIGESVFAAAARHGRRFGIVTITPDADLLASFAARAACLGLGAQYCGARVTPGDALRLLAHPERLAAALSAAVAESIQDGAQAIILGGGPLCAVAERLQPQCPVPLLNPVAAAARLALQAWDTCYQGN